MSTLKPSLEGLRIDESARSGTGRRAVAGLLCVMVVTAGVAAWWVWFGTMPALLVRVERVTERPSAAGNGVVLNASGYVTARRRATVSSKVTGKVSQVLVEEGMAVVEGQVLARLDDTTPRAFLAVAEAQLQAARRSLDETSVRLDEARVTLRRMRSLAEDGIANRADLDAAVAAVGALEARLAAEREQVSVAEANVALRRTELDDTTIRAPFSGVAVSKDAQPGEMISPVSAGGGFTRTGICTVVDMQSLEIEVDVNESYIGRVAPGQAVEATLDAYPDWRIPARVITLVPTADRQKATVLVRIGFEKLDPRILPDMGVKVAFRDQRGGTEAPRATAAHVVVPKTAIVDDNGQFVVFLVRDGHAVRRPVAIGPATGEGVQIVSGVTAGDLLVVDPPAGLADGQRVEVRNGKS
ncbi:MAG: efflux RND transporter periplasmic adaptor subunit [Vicinamibacterales bacterium]